MIEVVEGDCRTVLRQMNAGTVQCCVTSPPYFHLRDYQIAGQIGLEPTVDEYVQELVGVFREVRRVLHDTGVLFLNLGDSYVAGGNGARDPERWPKQSQNNNGHRNRHTKKHPGDGLKPKDLIGVPWMVAFALRADGWWLRSEVTWCKTAPMPESVQDRPTSATEKIFLLTKSPRYFYNAEAVKTPAKESTIQRLSQDIDAQEGSHRVPGKTNGAMKAVIRTDKQRGHSRRHDGFNDRWDAMSKDEQRALGANARNYLVLGPDPFKDAHYAVMPKKVAEFCIKAGSRERDTVLDPFGGAGTTGLVADRLGRDAVLIELNPSNVEMARRRIRNDAPLFAEVS